MFSAAVITISDKGWKGERIDASGPAIKSILESNGFEVKKTELVPDEEALIVDALKTCVSQKINLILTTGGTGFSKRDVTPEATLRVIERNADGIAEAIRHNSMQYTDRAMLSRAVAGIADDSLIINLPGSPKAVKECLDFIVAPISHGLATLLGLDSECARKDK